MENGAQTRGLVPQRQDMGPSRVAGGPRAAPTGGIRPEVPRYRPLPGVFGDDGLYVAGHILKIGHFDVLVGAVEVGHAYP